MLEDFFVADEGRFLVLEASASGGATGEKCGAMLAALSTGGAIAIAIPLDAQSRLRRLSRLLTFPFRMAQAEKMLARCGAISLQRYGVIPDLRTPTFVFPLCTPAARYAEENLVPAPRKWFPALVRKVLNRCLGFDPSLGAILVVGRKP